ncbi:hypothetical protein GGH12_002037 [Coemansia sp. RSA 1822]|nr:hypothetical protein LPJ76_002443 [Coemansia sp. RSA 638]KAJ2125227.1 hypothetical protein IW147_001126 [Coemansia sp. RSA 720]KAJ2481861.1 hypothetical protein IWW56_001477 [Coemansia sp. RSA 2131]KAJ2544270.1 hypothetical protein GGF49_001378 [Coemansia sp. RSA 1853]KAJ2564387.1 hypothetical protein GGH12_002037 [Coemansia sp. RSA 1822]KAJ2657686.1 hypothetical protein IW148_005051 [Coemansia sp. RSA 1199]
MVSEVNIFIIVAAVAVVLTVVIMLVVRRFQGQRGANQQNRRRPRHPRFIMQLQPSDRSTKPYNPFAKDELQLLNLVTLTQSDIDVLKSDTKIADSDSFLRYASPECSICLLQYEDGESARVLSCGHVYHVDCIDVWLTKRSARCPICKVDIRKELGLELRQVSATQEPADEPRTGQSPDLEASEDSELQSQARHHVVDIASPQPVRLSSS